jgi:hypothetical protein
MLKKIQSLLLIQPALKARNIATRLNVERSHVSAALHDHPGIFFQDGEFRWFLVFRVELKGEGWLTAASFEHALSSAGSPLDSSSPVVIIAFGKDCKIMLEALARLLALSNQLVIAGKRVSLDFSKCKSTHSYLDRMNFFVHLDRRIEVMPRRPAFSKAAKFNGNNVGVVELRAIDHLAPNQDIPVLLRNSFINCAGETYSIGAFTVLTELFKNIEEHSAATSAGFAGLQHYKQSGHIQAVISDSGLGIVGTLAPILEKRYPEIAKKIALSEVDPGVALLKEVFSAGGLSQVDEEGRGLGLKQSGFFAQKYKAKISVRQENFEVRVHHSPEGIRFFHSLNLVRIAGTHICFDLELAKI